jgi:hypothetical protein
MGIPWKKFFKWLGETVVSAAAGAAVEKITDKKDEKK